MLERRHHHRIFFAFFSQHTQISSKHFPTTKTSRLIEERLTSDRLSLERSFFVEKAGKFRQKVTKSIWLEEFEVSSFGLFWKDNRSEVFTLKCQHICIEQTGCILCALKWKRFCHSYISLPLQPADRAGGITNMQVKCNSKHNIWVDTIERSGTFWILLQVSTFYCVLWVNPVLSILTPWKLVCGNYLKRVYNWVPYIALRSGSQQLGLLWLFFALDSSQAANIALLL